MAQFFINEKIIEVIILTNFLMEKYGVGHFQFDFSNDKSKLGYCTANAIKLNYSHAFYSSIEEITQTLLHEIAHAIAGNENGHNTYWKSIAKDIGVKNI
jgi:predicted SprT family Zn-dependent metalloprotease